MKVDDALATDHQLMQTLAQTEHISMLYVKKDCSNSNASIYVLP